MKPPTEADLIDLENTALRHYRQKAEDDSWVGFGQYYRVVRTLETLIALARDPSQLLKYIPYDDDALDRALRTHCPIPGLSTLEPPRKGKLKPVSSVQPKPKKGKR
jgi:hypothetical protein